MISFCYVYFTFKVQLTMFDLTLTFHVYYSLFALVFFFSCFFSFFFVIYMLFCPSIRCHKMIMAQNKFIFVSSE